MLPLIIHLSECFVLSLTNRLPLRQSQGLTNLPCHKPTLFNLATFSASKYFLEYCRYAKANPSSCQSQTQHSSSTNFQTSIVALLSTTAISEVGLSDQY